jgi:flagellar L-ring protein precursor FlgH
MTYGLWLSTAGMQINGCRQSVMANNDDIKPNGNLVLEARARLRFENEIPYVALTGVCHSQDVSRDNTVLSTPLADKDITVHNDGLVRDGT